VLIYVFSVLLVKNIRKKITKINDKNHQNGIVNVLPISFFVLSDLN